MQPQVHPQYYKSIIPSYSKIVIPYYYQPQQNVQYSQQIQQVQQPLYTIGHTDTVKFFPDRCELLADVKEYRPEHLRVNVLYDRIELLANRPLEQSQHSLLATRIYQLPQRIHPTNSCCMINRDGILIVSVAWGN